MNRNLRFVAGSMVIVGAIAYLMYTGIRETSSYYLTIQEFLPKRDQYGEAPLRVAGRVKAGSTDYEARSLRLRFELTAFADAGHQDASVPVSFTGILPDMFADGRDVIVEGRYRGGVTRGEPGPHQLPVEVRGAGDGRRRRPRQAGR